MKLSINEIAYKNMNDCSKAVRNNFYLWHAGPLRQLVGIHNALVELHARATPLNRQIIKRALAELEKGVDERIERLNQYADESLSKAWKRIPRKKNAKSRRKTSAPSKRKRIRARSRRASA